MGVRPRRTRPPERRSPPARRAAAPHPRPSAPRRPRQRRRRARPPSRPTPAAWLRGGVTRDERKNTGLRNNKERGGQGTEGIAGEGDPDAGSELEASACLHQLGALMQLRVIVDDAGFLLQSTESCMHAHGRHTVLTYRRGWGQTHDGSKWDLGMLVSG